MAADELALDPSDSVGYLVRDIHRAIVQRVIRELKRHQVTLGMWFFLRALWHRDGLTQRELARSVRMTEPTAVVALKAMERRGLIGRIADTEDRRKAYIYLTPKGRTLRAQVMPFIVRQNEELLRGLPPGSREEFLGLLRRMHEHVSRIVEAEKRPRARRPTTARGPTGRRRAVSG
jgi:DNA-binding MarR family transcriptional regulator